MTPMKQTTPITLATLVSANTLPDLLVEAPRAVSATKALIAMKQRGAAIHEAPPIAESLAREIEKEEREIAEERERAKDWNAHDRALLEKTLATRERWIGYSRDILSLKHW